MLKHVLATLALTMLPLLAHAGDPVEGTDYTVLTTTTRVDVPGKIEVREFFWYGCPHCFRLDPFIEAWLKTKPADVNFIRTPAAMNPVWEVSARSFYAAQMLGLEEKTHVAMFNAIHQQNLSLTTADELASFYSGYGISSEAFASAYKSDAVSAKIQDSQALSDTYRLEGVPAIIVDGKYKVGGETQRTIDIVNFLIARERAQLPVAPLKPVPALHN